MSELRSSEPKITYICRYNEGMNKIQIKEVVRRLRASSIYADWVIRNKGMACSQCGDTENLELHHIDSLYHSVLDHFIFFGDWDLVYEHMIERHKADYISCATLCDKCHAKRHPNRNSLKESSIPIQTGNWMVAARNDLPTFTLKRAKYGHLGLIAFQMLLGIGNQALQGKLTGNILCIDKSAFAALLEKRGGSTWDESLARGGQALEEAGVLNAMHIGEEQVEFHIDKTYLNKMRENPWFISRKDALGKHTIEVFLRWLLSYQQNKTYYAIGVEKLAAQLGTDDSNMTRFANSIVKATKKTSWVEAEYMGGQLRFKLKDRQTTPVFSLRKIIMNQIS